MTGQASGLLLDIINGLSISNPRFLAVLIPVMIAQMFGFGVYIYAILIQKREHTSCYPPYIHTFFLAMDAFGAVYWTDLAIHYDHFWFFIFYAVALAVWCFLEVWSLYGAIKFDRKEFWGKYYDGDPTVKQATMRCAAQTLFFLVTIILYSYFMGAGDDASMIKFYVWSIMIPAFFPGYLWAQRRTRKGTSMGLAIFILLSDVAAFAPFGLGMWTALSSYFNTPIFYITGVVTICFAIYQIRLVKSFPPKEKPADGKRAIW